LSKRHRSKYQQFQLLYRGNGSLAADSEPQHFINSAIDYTPSLQRWGIYAVVSARTLDYPMPVSFSTNMDIAIFQIQMGYKDRTEFGTSDGRVIQNFQDNPVPVTAVRIGVRSYQDPTDILGCEDDPRQPVGLFPGSLTKQFLVCR
jgi:hypothetical protein